MLHVLKKAVHYLTCSYRSVEAGTQILPPFETPVGRVGLAICFDVSHVGAKCFSSPALMLSASIVTVP